MSALKVGDKVPEFELKSQNEENIRFEALRGKKVLISFYPLAFTPV
jgi:peroxiredoxin Q/BCP